MRDLFRSTQTHFLLPTADLQAIQAFYEVLAARRGAFVRTHPHRDISGWKDLRAFLKPPNTDADADLGLSLTDDTSWKFLNAFYDADTSTDINISKYNSSRVTAADWSDISKELTSVESVISQIRQRGGIDFRTPGWKAARVGIFSELQEFLEKQSFVSISPFNRPYKLLFAISTDANGTFDKSMFETHANSPRTTKDVGESSQIPKAPSADPLAAEEQKNKKALEEKKKAEEQKKLQEEGDVVVVQKSFSADQLKKIRDYDERVELDGGIPQENATQQKSDRGYEVPYHQTLGEKGAEIRKKRHHDKQRTTQAILTMQRTLKKLMQGKLERAEKNLTNELNNEIQNLSELVEDEDDDEPTFLLEGQQQLKIQRQMSTSRFQNSIPSDVQAMMSQTMIDSLMNCNFQIDDLQKLAELYQLDLYARTTLIERLEGILADLTP